MQALKAAFTNLMTCDASKYGAAVSALAARLTQEAAAGRALDAKEKLVLRLNEQYPGDVGVLSAYFLNLVGAAGRRRACAHLPGGGRRPSQRGCSPRA